MKKKYLTPEFETKFYPAEDILTMSNGGEGNDGDVISIGWDDFKPRIDA